MLTVGTLLLGGWMSGAASACKCEPKTPAEHIRSADAVYLAKAYAKKAEQTVIRQVFRVLQTIKGERPYTNTWALERDGQPVPNCSAQYAEGDAALIFVHNGELSICHGNTTLADQMNAGFADVLRVGKDGEPVPQAEWRPSPPLPPEVYKELFETTLSAYADRPSLTIRHPPQAGESLPLAGQTMRVVEGPTATVNIVDVVHFRNGHVTLVRGELPADGVRFYAFVAPTKAGPYVTVAQVLSPQAP